MAHSAGDRKKTQHPLVIESDSSYFAVPLARKIIFGIERTIKEVTNFNDPISYLDLSKPPESSSFSSIPRTDIDIPTKLILSGRNTKTLSSKQRKSGFIQVMDRASLPIQSKNKSQISRVLKNNKLISYIATMDTSYVGYDSEGLKTILENEEMSTQDKSIINTLNYIQRNLIVNGQQIINMDSINSVIIYHMDNEAIVIRYYSHAVVDQALVHELVIKENLAYLCSQIEPPLKIPSGFFYIALVMEKAPTQKLVAPGFVKIRNLTENNQNSAQTSSSHEVSKTPAMNDKENIPQKELATTPDILASRTPTHKIQRTTSSSDKQQWAHARSIISATPNRIHIAPLTPQAPVKSTNGAANLYRTVQAMETRNATGSRALLPLQPRKILVTPTRNTSGELSDQKTPSGRSPALATYTPSPGVITSVPETPYLGAITSIAETPKNQSEASPPSSVQSTPLKPGPSMRKQLFQETPPLSLPTTMSSEVSSYDSGCGLNMQHEGGLGLNRLKDSTPK